MSDEKLIAEAGLVFPLDTPGVVMFTEFAVPQRYEDLLDAEPLDRPAAVTLVDEVGARALSMLDRDNRKAFSAGTLTSAHGAPRG